MESRIQLRLAQLKQEEETLRSLYMTRLAQEDELALIAVVAEIAHLESSVAGSQWPGPLRSTEAN